MAINVPGKQTARILLSSFLPSFLPLFLPSSLPPSLPSSLPPFLPPLSYILVSIHMDDSYKFGQQVVSIYGIYGRGRITAPGRFPYSFREAREFFKEPRIGLVKIEILGQRLNVPPKDGG